MEEPAEMVGRAFVDHYYHLFDNDRASLSSLYRDTSLMTFEGQRICGVSEISSKLTQLPFDQCRHVISTIDSQPSAPAGGGVVVFVSGSLQLAGEEHHLRFSQMFHLIPAAECFYVQNDIFRLNYG
ncbi:nuclear transport factor 2B-like [Prosopis cineraria]|uniref:nuclear transport factor 2B-like n=1 Tax=Prosopis cineraria TaxID=364024 RepID=UPI00240FC20B|nr:nuclear transport factor 2B-like [Prosopis cineraria]XP_054793272.1 nuclear transport factor 2B-like [Prosopis cineraria]